jgi:hypothetical protein
MGPSAIIPKWLFFRQREETTVLALAISQLLGQWKTIYAGVLTSEN